MTILGLPVVPIEDIIWTFLREGVQLSVKRSTKKTVITLGKGFVLSYKEKHEVSAARAILCRPWGLLIKKVQSNAV